MREYDIEPFKDQLYEHNCPHCIFVSWVRTQRGPANMYLCRKPGVPQRVVLRFSCETHDYWSCEIPEKKQTEEELQRVQHKVMPGSAEVDGYTVVRLQTHGMPAGAVFTKISQCYAEDAAEAISITEHELDNPHNWTAIAAFEGISYDELEEYVDNDNDED